jgi:hypothetical protein
MIGKPQHTCTVCGEFLPHACAPVVLISEYLTRHHRRRRRTQITDRPEGSRSEGERRIYAGLAPV